MKINNNKNRYFNSFVNEKYVPYENPGRKEIQWLHIFFFNLYTDGCTDGTFPQNLFCII